MIIENGILNNEELVRIYQNSNDKEIKSYCISEIYEKNKKFVMKLAHESYKQEFDDAVQNGCIGLIRAMETYKVDSNHKFITHAYLNVKAYINNPVRHRVKDSKEKIYSLEKMKTEYGTFIELPSEINIERYLCNKETLIIALKYVKENFDELSNYIFNQILSGNYGDGDVKRISKLKSVSCATVTNRKNKLHQSLKEYFKSMEELTC